MAGSSSKIDFKNGDVVQCFCMSQAKIVKAWTDTNPGRRFYTCGRGVKVGNKYEGCNFFRWFDAEKPHGWQYHALLEARDVIRKQKDEVKMLRNMIDEKNQEIAKLEMKSSSEIVHNFLLNLEE